MNKKGFTVIEFLLASAVVGISLAIGCIVFKNIRIAQTDVQTAKELEYLYRALNRYSEMNGKYPIVLAPGIELGATNSTCLNEQGFHSSGCVHPIHPVLPKGFVYISETGETYTIETEIQGKIWSLSGKIMLTPEGVAKR